jgi:uncharacterized integral membrane protein
MKILWWIIAVPIALFLVMLAVANRDMVTLSLDPIGGDISLPLYLVIFCVFLLGLICGGLLTWASGVKRRRRKRREEREKAAVVNRHSEPTLPTAPF